MWSLQTKSKRNKLLIGISFVMLFLSFSLFSYSISNLSLAEDGVEDEEDLWMINLDDYVVLTWVANTVEYLTALYLYADDPYSSTSVVLRYDSWLNALVINSSINANAMGIWYKDFLSVKTNREENRYSDFNEWIAWSVFVWWSGNKLDKTMIGSYNEYWDYVSSLNWRNDSAVIVWGEGNTASQAWTVIVWWSDVSLKAEYLSIIWSNNVSVDHSSESVVLWGKNVYFWAWAWHWFYAWNNLKWGYDNYLIWSWIDTQSPGHYSDNLRQTFAWSTVPSWLEIKWGLGWYVWFYVNTENGLWLNTSTPRVSFDIRSWGPLKLWKFKWVNGYNLMVYKDDQKLLCNEGVDMWNLTQKYRWTVVYVELKDNGKFIGAWFCWCNGMDWTPMSNDTLTQYVCTNYNANDRKQNCLGEEWLNNVVLHKGTEWLQRWDEEANGWIWGWVKLNWTFWWVPGLLEWSQRECVYSCKVWYHPGVKSPQGWFTWDCQACTKPYHSVFISPWTWYDDCQFVCEAWYKYNWWTSNRETEWCTACKYWEWTTWMNQALMCERCEYPIWVSASLKNSDWTSMKFYSWSMWNSTTKTWTRESYFAWFTSFGTKWKYSCNYDCSPGYMYSFNWTKWWNFCTECEIGTYSPGWQYSWEAWGTCAKCTNKSDKSISFSWKDFNWVLQTWTIAAKDVSWYTSKWKGTNNCEWTCNPIIWLVKDWDSCKCPDGSHLELLGAQPRCISNNAEIGCSWGPLSSLALRGSPYKKIWGTANWYNFTWNLAYWTYTTNSSDLWKAQFSCPTDYSQDGYKCKTPLYGECGSINWTSVESISKNDSSLCSNGTKYADYTEVEIKYFGDDNKFQFFPLNTIQTNENKYLVTWTCKWKDNKPEYSASCYAYKKWTSKPGKCPTNSRDTNGKALIKCDTDFSVCKDKRSCPTIQNTGFTKYVDLRNEFNIVPAYNNIEDNWKYWSCPWVFWWKSADCHSCDKNTSWSERRHWCTLDKIIIKCSNAPKNWNNINSWAAQYWSTFSEEVDTYNPWQKKWERLDPDYNWTLEACQYKCKKNYHRYNNECVKNPKVWAGGSEDHQWLPDYDDLCSAGKPSKVSLDDDGYFTWTCSNWSMSEEWKSKSYSCPYACTKTISYAAWKRNGYETNPWNNTFYDNWTNVSWKTCPCICNDGYHVSGGTCVKNPSCWSSNGLTTWYPSSLCNPGTASPVWYYNAGTTFTWTCTNWSRTTSPSCSSSCPENKHVSGGVCVDDPSCWSKNKGIWKPSNAEKCGIGTPSDDFSYTSSRVMWSCSNWSKKERCWSSYADAVCDYSTIWWCTAWTPVGDIITPEIPNWEVRVWNCNWIWGWSNVMCRLGWECWGTCNAVDNDSCKKAYVSSSFSTENGCKNAWVLVKWDPKLNSTSVEKCNLYWDGCYNLQKDHPDRHFWGCFDWTPKLKCNVGHTPVVEKNASYCSGLPQPSCS